MFSAILEKVERLERENAELRQSLNDLSRRLTTIESNKYVFDEKIETVFDNETFINEAIDEKIETVFDNKTFIDEAIDDKIETVFNNKTFADCLNEVIDKRIETVFHNKGLDDVVCVGIDQYYAPKFVSKNVELICNSPRSCQGRFGFERLLTENVRVFYLECLIHFKDMIIEYELLFNIDKDITFLYKGCLFEIKTTTNYCLDTGTPEQTKLFFQAFDDVGIKLLYNSKPLLYNGKFEFIRHVCRDNFIYCSNDF